MAMRARVWIAMLVAVCLIAGCDRHAATPAAREPVHVLCDVFPVADIVRQIGQEYVTVDWVAEGGQDPRHLQLDPDMRARAMHADLLVVSGFEDRWAVKDLTPDDRAQHVIDPRLLPAGQEDGTLLGASTGLWLDPKLMIQLCGEIASRLSLRDPDHDSQFRANAASYRQQLEKLDAEFTRTLAPITHRRFMTLQPMWGAMAHRYGLEEINPVDVAPTRVREQDVRALTDAAQKNRAGVLVVDSALPAAVMRDLHERTGLKVIVLDALGSSASDGHHGYLSLMRYNLQQLADALR